MRGIWSSLDWVITGYRQEGRCFVLASDRLAKGALETRTEMEAVDPLGLIAQNRPVAHSFRLTVESQRVAASEPESLYAIAWGDTYEEALRRLMEGWRPSEEERPRPGLPPSMKELE